jgi:hypothetical protein
MDGAFGHWPLVPINACVTLTKEEVRHCWALGREKLHNIHKFDSVNRRYSKLDDLTVDTMGYLGEYAFLKLFKLNQKALVHEKMNFLIDTFDATLDGLTVDVKCTVKLGAPIRVTTWKEQNPADLYCLMYLLTPMDAGAENREAVVQFCGFVDKKSLFQVKNLQAFVTGDTVTSAYILPARELQPLENLCHTFSKCLPSF